MRQQFAALVRWHAAMQLSVLRKLRSPLSAFLPHMAQAAKKLHPRAAVHNISLARCRSAAFRPDLWHILAVLYKAPEDLIAAGQAQTPKCSPPSRYKTILDIESLLAPLYARSERDARQRAPAAAPPPARRDWTAQRGWCQRIARACACPCGRDAVIELTNCLGRPYLI